MALALNVILLPVPAKSQVVANPGANLNVDGQTIATTTDNTPALHAAGGTITGTGTTVSTTGNGGGVTGSEGALATAGGQITLTNSSITTTGSIGVAYGLHTMDTGSTITITSTTVTTLGFAVVNDGGTITINGGSINGSGGGLVGNDGTITATGTTITLDGPSTAAAWATGPARIDLTNTTINLNGTGTYGLYAYSNGVVTMDGGAIAGTQDGSIGALAGYTPAGGPGLIPGEINMTGVTVQLQGNGATGLMAGNGSVLNFTDGSVNVQGAGSFALRTNGYSYNNTLNISGSIVTAPDGIAIGVQGNQGTINITNGSTVTGGTGGLMLVEHLTDLTNPGVAILTADNSTLTGNITVDGAATNTASITLRNNATLTGDINVDTANGAFADLAAESGAIFTGATQDVRNVATSGGTWNVTADSTVTDTLTNGGVVAFVSGRPFRTLTTTNYVGTGGTMRFNTQLGDSSSPTDQLVVNGGTITGTTGITVNNAGGAGAVTTGNGIPIVVAQSGATSSANAFTLAARVAAGAFEYGLRKGASGSADDLNSWYLCNTTGCATFNPSGGPPDGGPTGSPDEPLYRGEVAMHAVYGAMARQLGLLTLGTFHERNGDQQLAAADGRERGWARVFGQHMEQSHSGEVRPSTDGEYYGIQGGIDAIRTVSATGHLDRAGLFAAHATAHVDVAGHILAIPNLHVGRTDLDATSVGGYWSHLAPSGWYTDAVVMGTVYDGDGGTFDGSKVGVSGTGAIASIEGGFPLLKLWGMTLQQQAQLVYQYLNLDEANDPYSHVAHDTPDALHGRIGWRLSADGLPWLFKPFLKANLWQDFAGKDTAIYAHTHEIVNRHRSTTLELGGGFVANIAPNVGLWASADYATDIGGTEQEREAVRGTAGLRITW